MATKKTIKATEPPKDKLRLFTRVGSQGLVPTEIYDLAEVPKEDRAIFNVKPADPATKDILREVRQSIEIAYTSIDDDMGLSYEMQSIAIATAEAFSGTVDENGQVDMEKAGAVEVTEEQVKLMTTFSNAQKHKKRVRQLAICDSETREAMADCVTIENYKEEVWSVEDKKFNLLPTDKSNREIVLSMPDCFAVWLYEQIEEASGLRDSEVLGV